MNDLLTVAVWLPALAVLWRINLRNKGHDVSLVPTWVKWSLILIPFEVWVSL